MQTFKSLFLFLSCFLSCNSFGQQTSITSQIKYDTTVCVNATLPSLSVMAIGVNLNYQWYTNDLNLPIIINGETNSSYTPNTSADSIIHYFCIVSGDNGSDTSEISTIITNALTINNFSIIDTTLRVLNDPYTFNWSYTIQENIIPIFSSLPDSLFGAFSNNTLTFSGIPLTTGNFPYTLSFQNGCNTNNYNGIIHVYDRFKRLLVTTNYGTDQQVQENHLLNPVNFAVYNATGMHVHNLPPGVNATLNNNTLTLSGTPTAYGFYQYLIYFEGNDSIADGNIFVNHDLSLNLPLVSASYSDTQYVCNNTPIIPIIYSVFNATGATFSGLPNGVTGIFQNNQIIISGTPDVSDGMAIDYLVVLEGNDSIARGRLLIETEFHVVNNLYATPILSHINNVFDIDISTAQMNHCTFSGLPLGFTGTFQYDSIAFSGLAHIHGVPVTTGGTSLITNYSNDCGSTLTAITPFLVLNDTTILTLISPDSTDYQLVIVGDSITPIHYFVEDTTNVIVTGLPNGVNWHLEYNYVIIEGAPTISGNFVFVVSNGPQKSTSQYSLSGTIISGNLAYINELKTTNFVCNIYPNPSSGLINIEAITGGYYFIINSQGKIITYFDLNKSNNYKVQISGLESGFYRIVNKNTLKDSKSFIIN
ncbi:MAG: hypothetical protein HYR91_12940 [Flavobacteriia bacterium]|nr:hypothetical protein [Flavobacteriia bacterium]